MSTDCAPLPSILFIHLTFGAQFEFFGQWMARNGWVVYHACSAELEPSGQPVSPAGIHLRRFNPQKPVSPPESIYYTLEYAASNATAAATLFYHMRKAEGFIPDVVIAHSGWGVGLCVKSIWPETYYIVYHEWYYSHLDWQSGRSITSTGLPQLVDMRMRNMPIVSEFDTADQHWCPTEYQASRFPPKLRAQISVIPDGVDVNAHAPDPDARLDSDWLRLPEGRKVLTYATRGMEPLRGFPQFLAGLAILQKRRDDFETVILAGEQVSYGSSLSPDDSWRMRMIAMLDLDQRHLHVFSMRNRLDYQNILRVSQAHIYFTEPFVTSWSLSEAMASGCLVIGSNTPPVQEMITDMENGILVDMDDPQEIADMIEWAFDHPEEAAQLRAKARHDIVVKAESERIFKYKSDMLREITTARKNAAHSS